MGQDNRAFIQTAAQDGSSHHLRNPQYLGSQLEFDVDLSHVPCSCQAHVYLAKVDESSCSWANEQNARVISPCTSIDLMMANDSGFKSQFRTCQSWGGGCELEAKCQRKATDGGNAAAFGKGPNYDIDTNNPFHMTYQFWVDEDADGNRGSLTDIRQVISQVVNGVSKEVIIDSNCTGVSDLTAVLPNMSLGVANYDVG